MGFFRNRFRHIMRLNYLLQQYNAIISLSAYSRLSLQKSGIGITLHPSSYKLWNCYRAKGIIHTGRTGNILQNWYVSLSPRGSRVYAIRMRLYARIHVAYR